MKIISREATSLFKGVILLLLFFVVTISSVNAQPTYAPSTINHNNGTASPENGQIWYYGSISKVCNGDFTIVYSFGGSGTGDPKLQYNLDAGGWNDVSSGTAYGPGTSLELQIVVTDLPIGADVTLDVMVYESINVSFTEVTSISCNGVSDGAITATAQCGQVAVDESFYSWTGPDSYISNGASAINGLEAGIYEVTYDNEEDEPFVDSYVLGEPFELTYSLPDPLYFCGASNGQITVTPSGGTADYTVEVVGGNDVSMGIEVVPNGSAEYTGLDNDTYTITVSDVKGCNATPQVITIAEDVTPPTFDDANFPADIEISPGVYNPGNEVLDVSVATDFTALDYTAATYPLSLTQNVTVDLNNYSNAKLSIEASQSGDGWITTDYLQIELSTDGGSTFPFMLLNDHKVWGVNVLPDLDGASEDGIGNTTPTSVVDIALDALADFNSEVMLRITINIDQSGLEYDISSFTIAAQERIHAVNPLDYGTGNPPVGIDDESGISLMEYVVEPAEVYCISAGSEEFRVPYKWTATNGCLATAERIQYLRVGTDPYFQATTFPADAVFNYCDLTQSITGPTPDDDCSGVEATLSYIVTELPGGSLLTSGDGDISTVTFEADKSYEIEWTATDDVGFTYSQNQQVLINPVITANIDIPSGEDYDLCIDEGVVITITPSGGTGSFDLTSFNPSDGLWDGTYYVYETSWSSAGSPQFSIEITDLPIAGTSVTCTTDPVISSGIFTIHENITTNEITRTP